MTVKIAARAGLWSAIDIVLRQGIGFVVSIILARLLAPEDFGLLALLGFFVSLSIVFVQGGLTLAIVQRQDTSHEQETAVFWGNLIVSIVFALILIAVAPLISRFYGFPLLDPLMYVAAAQIVLSALGAVHTARLNQRLRFAELTKTGVISSLASGGAGLAAAYAGWGIWALAVQLLTMSATGTIALWWVDDWRPAWRVRFSTLRTLLGFGASISLAAALDLVYSNGVVLVIAKFFGAGDVGFLHRAATIQSLPTGIITAVVARTALPLFAARAGDTDGLRRGFKMATSLAMVLSLPLMAGLAVLADLVILALIGPKWLPAAPVLAISAVAGMLLPLHMLNLQLLLAQGGSKDFLSLEIKKKVVGVPCYGVGCFYGIIGVAYASLLFSVIAFFINASPTKKSLDYGAARQLNDLRGVFGLTAVMAATVYALRHTVNLPPALLLGLLVAVGGVVYVGGGLLLRLKSVADAIDMIDLATGEKLRLPGRRAASTA